MEREQAWPHLTFKCPKRICSSHDWNRLKMSLWFPRNIVCYLSCTTLFWCITISEQMQLLRSLKGIGVHLLWGWCSTREDLCQARPCLNHECSRSTKHSSVKKNKTAPWEHTDSSLHIWNYENQWGACCGNRYINLINRDNIALIKCNNNPSNEIQFLIMSGLKSN